MRRAIICSAIALLGCAAPRPPPPPNPARECFDVRVSAASFNSLRTKIVLGLERPSLDMQANRQTPDAQDRSDILEYARVREECFRAGERWAQQFTAPVVRAIGENVARAIDANLSSLYRSDMTFGQYNVSLEAVRADGHRKIDEAREIERREADAARRQAALAALMMFPPPPQPRPLPPVMMTNCQTIGAQTFCSTY